MECCVVVIDQEPAWMQVITLKQIYFFLFKMYLFDCAGSQLQHMKFLIISAHRVFS